MSIPGSHSFLASFEMATHTHRHGEPGMPNVGVFYGHSNCDGLVRFYPTVCGCWYGSGGATAQMPSSFPIQQLDSAGPPLQKYDKRGCTFNSR